MFSLEAQLNTIIIIVLTCITSIRAFDNADMKSKLIFSPYIIKRKREWFRFITYGFVHGDWVHLILNMVVLYMFGQVTEQYFRHPQVFGHFGGLLYLAFYIIAIPLSETFSYFRHQDNSGYASNGASGAVSAVIFASILFDPHNGIGLLIIPGIEIPGYLFGTLYLLYSMHMARTANDNIGHFAHFYGALFGFIFPIALKPALFTHFLNQF